MRSRRVTFSSSSPPPPPSGSAPREPEGLQERQVAPVDGKLSGGQFAASSCAPLAACHFNFCGCHRRNGARRQRPRARPHARAVRMKLMTNYNSPLR
ncbi:hypothetical protein OJAV_G00165060 [Oryzias javanicus]|uniref:Uncharacterized protein n=1 Tax=Oryzias javanicus TaxID=123683 RepID=A0A3S2MNH3_ORYJA|nr:hypothetical protein OJAV_G00165060 [Oryzias javanicus]